MQNQAKTAAAGTALAKEYSPIKQREEAQAAEQLLPDPDGATFRTLP